MPNAVAYAALITWPFVTLALFATLRPERALICSLLAGYLLLPVKTAFDFPGVPALDKTTIANVSALVGAIIFGRQSVTRLPKNGWVLGLLTLSIISPMFTVFSNRDALMFGSVVLPGLRPYDALSAAAYKAIDLIPFILSYNMLADRQGQHYLIRAFVISALWYSLLMLVEIRLSPQLHTWVYGFFPHSFGQQIRDGGFRPVVFLGHGLLVAIFTCMAVLAAAYVAKRQEKIFGLPGWVWLAYLMCLLILCRSFGALIIAVLSLGVFFGVPKRGQRVICATIAISVLVYPALRGIDVVPVQAVANEVLSISEERAGSFQTRIDNENALLARANQRPLFGWGGYGRNRVYDEFTGQDLSITDGTWVIIAGTNGWAGYLSTFGLLSIAVVLACRRAGKLGQANSIMPFILVVNMVDLIPNSSLTPLTWLLAGAVLAEGEIDKFGGRSLKLHRKRKYLSGSHQIKTRV